jgi:hypothetical protein
VHGGIGDRHAGVDHGAPFLLDPPFGREQKQGDLHNAAELTGAGGLQIQHSKAAGTSGEQSRQGQRLAKKLHGRDWHPLCIAAAKAQESPLAP